MTVGELAEKIRDLDPELEIYPILVERSEDLHLNSSSEAKLLDVSYEEDVDEDSKWVSISLETEDVLIQEKFSLEEMLESYFRRDDPKEPAIALDFQAFIRTMAGLVPASCPKIKQSLLFCANDLMALGKGLRAPMSREYWEHRQAAARARYALGDRFVSPEGGNEPPREGDEILSTGEN